MSEQAPVRIAGSYDLLQLSIISLSSGGGESIRRLVHHIEINETVDRTYLTGTLTVTDGTDLIRRLPITGNELLVIETKDYYGAILKEAYKIYAVSDYKTVSEQDTNLVQFKLHFCSREKFVADTMDIKRAFRGPIHEQALEVYNQYIKTFEDSQLKGAGIDVNFKGLTVQLTEGEHVYTIPNMKPDQSMAFLAKRAYSSDSPAGVFKFWETRKGFHFLSLQGSEDAYKLRYNGDIPYYFYSTAFQNLPGQQDEKMRQVLSLGLNKTFNTQAAFRSGGYTSRVLEIDILNRTPIETRYNHIDEMENNSSATYKAMNSQLFGQQSRNTVNAYFTEGPEFLVIKDYPSVGTDTSTLPTDQVMRAIRSRQEYAENTVKMLAYQYQLEQNKIEVTVHGSYAVFAGAYIFLAMPSNYLENAEFDPIVAGFYLVHSCSHVYNGNSYYCKLVVTRPGENIRPDVDGTDVIPNLAAQRQALEALENGESSINVGTQTTTNTTGAQIILENFNNEALGYLQNTGRTAESEEATP